MFSWLRKTFDNKGLDQYALEIYSFVTSRPKREVASLIFYANDLRFREASMGTPMNYYIDNAWRFDTRSLKTLFDMFKEIRNRAIKDKDSFVRKARKHGYTERHINVLEDEINYMIKGLELWMITSSGPGTPSITGVVIEIWITVQRFLSDQRFLSEIEEVINSLQRERLFIKSIGVPMESPSLLDSSLDNILLWCSYVPPYIKQQILPVEKPGEC